MQSQLDPQRRQPDRGGLTLIELLVVVSILLILAVVTVSAVNLTIDGDKVRAGARQVQSYLEGARDRAIYAREPRGVRFLLDANDPRTVTSMIYIAPSDYWTEGTIVLERPDGDNDGNAAFSDTNDPLNPTQSGGIPTLGSDDEVWVVRGFDGDTSTYTKDTNWKDLYNRGLLQNGLRIQIPPETGAWYTIDTRLLPNADVSDNDPPVRLLLQQPYREFADTTPASTTIRAFAAASAGLRYRLELMPAPLPGQEPVLLPRGSVIHLDRSSSAPDVAGQRGDKLPSSWRLFYANMHPSVRPPVAQQDPSGFAYSPQCDVMFSPRGVVIGPAASTGIIHFYVGDLKDSDQDRIDWLVPQASAPEYAPRTPGDNYQRRDKAVVSLFTRTGAISVNPIFTDANGVTPPGQRFRYSETGEVAGR